jgi:hypothetical protein
MKLDGTGTGTVTVRPEVGAIEWDIYQISVQTQLQTYGCSCNILYNGFFLCGTFQGWQDTATGPPDAVLQPNDRLMIQFNGGAPGDTATVGIWFNENPTNTTYSTAH